MMAKTVNEVITCHAGVDGDIASRVNCSPNTAHGWRPISVKIQPNALPKTASGADQINARQTHLLLGNLPRRVNQSPSTPNAVVTAPSPIMYRKLQYVTGMDGR